MVTNSTVDTVKAERLAQEERSKKMREEIVSDFEIKRIRQTNKWLAKRGCLPANQVK